MKNLHQLAVAIGDAAYKREAQPELAATAYYVGYRAVMDNADKISCAYQLDKMREPVPLQMTIDRLSAKVLTGKRDLLDALAKIEELTAHDMDELEDANTVLAAGIPRQNCSR